MKRVMIVGQPGAGKSWLAREIGARTGLPVHHMDMIHWQPGWIERAKPEKIAMAQAVEATDRWVFEGGLSSTYDTRLARADTLIVLIVPLHLRSWRIFTRTLRDWGQSRPDLPENCPERFSLEFWSYIWRTRHSGSHRILTLASKAGPEKQVHILRNRRDVARYLKALDAATQTGQNARHEHA